MTGAQYDATLWPEGAAPASGSTTPALPAATRFDVANMGSGHFRDLPERSAVPPRKTRAYRRARWPREARNPVSAVTPERAQASRDTW